MNLITEPYLAQKSRWPKQGRHILAQFAPDSVVVYQAYRPEIGRFAAGHGYFGGAFSLERTSWIKPNFLWMMYRSGWGTKEGQEITLAVRLQRDAFDEILGRPLDLRARGLRVARGVEGGLGPITRAAPMGPGSRAFGEPAGTPGDPTRATG